MTILSVSVIITSYNHLEFLKVSVSSVMAQTYKPHEIIIVDDCSTDGSVDYLKTLQEKYPEWIKVILHKQNIGISDNRNSGLRIATGEYVAVLDGDDRYLPDFLEVLVTQYLDESSNVQCAYSNVYLIDANGERIGVRDQTRLPSGDILFELSLGKMGIMRAMIAATNLVRQAGMFNPAHPKHDGYILSVELARMTNYAYCGEPLAEYRIHKKGDSKTYGFLERRQYLQNVYQKVNELGADLIPLKQNTIQSTWYFRLIRMELISNLEEQHYISGYLRYISRIILHPRHLYYLLFRR